MSRWRSMCLSGPFDNLEERAMMCGDLSAVYSIGVASGANAAIELESLPDCEIRPNGTTAGDINGDGIDDLVFGSPSVNDFTGQAYVVYGSADGNVPHFDLLDGTNGFVIEGYLPGGQVGWAVSDAGDINGDGIDDVAIGAPTANSFGSGTGQVYVVFGERSERSQVDLEFLDGSDGFVIEGIEEGDGLGAGIDAAGDFNGDGIDDLILAAPTAQRDGVNDVGEAYVVFGRGSFSPEIELLDLDVDSGVLFSDRVFRNVLGHSVAGVGDINGDGLSDIAIGTGNHDAAQREELGYALVVFGASDLPREIAPEDLDGANGFQVQAFGQRSYVGAAGDFNGDGRDDVVIGDDVAVDGVINIIYGSDAPFPEHIPAVRERREVFDGEFGVSIRSALGGPVTTVGDVNGDGVDDILASSSRNTILSRDRSVLFFGSPNFESNRDYRDMDNTEAMVVWGTSLDSFDGQDVAAAGDFNSDGVDDFFVASAGVGYLLSGLEGFNEGEQPQPERGDLNRDGVIDAADIDRIAACIRRGIFFPEYDLDNDEDVDNVDKAILVNDIIGISHGDANLDGVVDFSDFLALSSNFGAGNSWDMGDFTGDARIDFDDFLVLSANFMGEDV